MMITLKHPLTILRLISAADLKAQSDPIMILAGHTYSRQRS